MSVEAVLRTVTSALESAGIPFMVTGSFASAIHGEPRASKDIDIVISPTREQLVEFVRLFPNDRYYALEDDALESFSHHSMFNIIDFRTGWKVDLIFIKPREFSRTEFGRRRVEDLGDLKIPVATAEDILIAKLEWAKMGESARQLEDAAGIVRMKGRELDEEYVEHWVKELELAAQWLAVRRSAGAG